MPTTDTTNEAEENQKEIFHTLQQHRLLTGQPMWKVIQVIWRNSPSIFFKSCSEFSTIMKNLALVHESWLRFSRILGSNKAARYSKPDWVYVIPFLKAIAS